MACKVGSEAVADDRDLHVDHDIAHPLDHDRRTKLHLVHDDRVVSRKLLFRLFLVLEEIVLTKAAGSFETDAGADDVLAVVTALCASALLCDRRRL